MARQAARRSFIELMEAPSDWYLEVNDSIMSLNYLQSEEVWFRKSPKQPAPEQEDDETGRKCPEDSKVICQPYEENPSLILSTIQLIYTVATGVIVRPKQPADTTDDFEWRDAISPYFNNVFVDMGKNLSHKAAGELCRAVFSAKLLSGKVINLFFTSFFPHYLERTEYSWETIDLLKRAHTARPLNFRRLFARHLVKNVKIPKRVLQDFVVNIAEDKRGLLMDALLIVKFSSKQFVHNLVTINALFLGSDLSPPVVSYVTSYLEQYASDCYNNRDFGRLLLSVIKNKGKTGGILTYREIAECHGTEYKSSCLAVLDDIERERFLTEDLVILTQPIIIPEVYRDLFDGIE